MSRQSSHWTQWPPALLEEFRREVSKLMEGVWEPDDAGRFIAPSTNVAETEHGFEVTVDLPGVQAQDVQIEVKEGQLWITGERKVEAEEKGKTYHRLERRSGRFRRVLPLGANVDVDGVDASCRDGVLTVKLPKAEAAKPKRIEVKG